MVQNTYSAVFMRGGTSKGVFFLEENLPADLEERNRLIVRVLGSPDPYGRQLDGMGGGISSLSKTMIVAPSERDDVDVDYLAGQIAVGDPLIDYSANCGNLSAAVGVFAVEHGLVDPVDGETVVRMYNLNTAKRVDCIVPVADGAVVTQGPFQIAGVAGSGAPIRLDFLEPGGASTGSLLPTGREIDELSLPDGTCIRASIVDASTLCVFVRAADLGVTGTELPTALRSKIDLIGRMEMIRGAAAVAAGVAKTAKDAARTSPTAPRVAMVAPAADSPTLSGDRLSAEACDIQVRMLSMGVPHMAIPLTGAMCTTVAAQIAGTLVREAARPANGDAPFRIGHGSGAVPVMAAVRADGNAWFAEKVSVFRTARTLMDGKVFVPMADLAAE